MSSDLIGEGVSSIEREATHEILSRLRLRLRSMEEEGVEVDSMAEPRRWLEVIETVVNDERETREGGERGEG